MKPLNDFSFHEATLVNFITDTEKEQVGIELDGVTVADNKKISGRLFIKSKLNFKIEGKKVHEIKKIYEDGEVLDLEINNNKIELLIEWNDFLNKKTLTLFYEIEGETVYWVDIK